VSARVYLPTTLTLLRSLLASGVVATASTRGHAVTDAVRRALPDADEEDLEYVACSAAAQESVALLRPEERPRRAVLAVDVPAPQGTDDPDDPTSVLLLDEVRTRQVAALLLDSPDAGRVVGTARDALLTGSSEAALLLELCLDHELGWWAAQEIAGLLEDESRASAGEAG
jgi:hypothetical protein